MKSSFCMYVHQHDRKLEKLGNPLQSNACVHPVDTSQFKPPACDLEEVTAQRFAGSSIVSQRRTIFKQKLQLLELQLCNVNITAGHASASRNAKHEMS